MALKFLNDGFFDGKVGIGTTTPDATLEPVNISATSDGDGSASDTLSGQDSILLSTKAGTFEETSGSITWRNGDRRRAMITGVNESATGDGDVLGLAFYTQGTDGAGDFFESMRIAHSGNVGIGTDSPTVKFHVLGQDATFYSGTTTQQMNIGRNAGERIEIFIDDNTNKIRAIQDSEVGVDFSFILDRSIVGTDLDAVHNFEIQKDGAAQVLVDKDGNVGIGETDPQSKLQVDGGISVGDGTTRSEIKPPTSGNANMTFAANAGNANTAVSEFIFTNSLNGSSTRNESMRINSAGKVGIGTTNPEYKLHVNSNDASDDVTFIHHNSAGQTSGNVLRVLSDAGDNTGSALLNVGNGTGFAMYARGDRRVGIGTNTPDAGLAVKGLLSLALSGTITISNSSNAVTGTNTAFLTELKILDAIKIGAEIFTISAIGSNTSLTLDSNVSIASTNVTAFIDPRLLSVRNGDSRAEAVIDKSGNFSVGDISNNPEQTTNGIPKFQVKTATAVLGEFPLAARFTTAVDAGDNSGVSVLINSGNDRGLMISAGRQNGNVAKASLNIVGSDGVEIQTMTLLQRNVGGTIADVGIGTTTPKGKLHILDGTAATYTPNGESDTLVIESGVPGGVSLIGTGAGGNQKQSITFGTTADVDMSRIIYDPNNSFLRIGTNVANNYVAFSSGNDAEAMRILGNQNVGIGTTNPAAKLEITGSTPTAGDTTLHLKLPVGNVTAGTTEMGNILFSSTDASNGGSGSIAKISTIAGNGSNAWIGQGRPTDLAFFTQPIGDTATLVEAMRINQNGNVGIGTATPLAKLDIKETVSDVAGQIILGGLIGGGTDNVAFGKLNFANTNVANTQTNDILASISGEKPDSSNRGELVFSTSNETAPVERMRIDKDGKVGIGTDSPDVLLHVKAATDVTGTIEVQGGKAIVTAIGEVNSELNFGSNDSSIVGGIGGSIKSITEFANGAKTGIGFYTAFQGRTPELKEAMRINNVGDVGIGTSTPLTGGSDAKWLTVNGEAASTYSGGILYAINSAAKGFSYFQSDYLIQQSMEGYGQKFMVNNTNTAMTILQGGNVGIGTTNPEHVLHVKDDTATISVDYANPMGKMRFGSIYNSTYQTADVMVLQGNGNVGIGTPSPTRRLEISEGGNGNSKEAIFRLIGTNTLGAGSSVSEIVSRQVVGGGAEEAAMDIRVRQINGLFASPNTVMTLEGGGNVGIGTTAPTEKFVVNGSVNSINQSASFATGPYRATMDIISSIKLVRIGSVKGAVTPTGDEGEVAFFVNSVEKARIDKDGNFGVGTTNPSEKLDVEGGNIRLVDASAGLIFTAPNGKLWKQTISNTGVPVYTDVSP